MKATLLASRRTVIATGVFVETVLWQVPVPLRGSKHSYKYRLALVADDMCVLRYDNEAGKGDHCHVGQRELPYAFSNVDRLLEDFGSDVRKWLDENRGF
jgi:hypothetical protein